MAKRSADKIKKLLDFQEHERDVAAVKMGEAMRVVEKAKQEREEADNILNKELDEFRILAQQAMNPLDMELSKLTTKQAEIELQQSETKLNQANINGEKSREILMTTHIKMKQMEVLHQNEIKARNIKINTTEQSRIDDLVITKASSKPN